MDKKNLYKYIHAFILGDGGVYLDKRDNGNAYLATTKTEANLDFLEWAKTILEEITTIKITRFSGNQSTKPYYRLFTMRHPIYTKFRQRMYPNGYKCLNPHYLKLFDWETLAILFMDDGSVSANVSKKSYGSYKYPRISLCTQSFSYADNVLLSQVIKEKLNVDFYVTHNNYKSGTKYYLYSSNKSIDMFYDGVYKYITPSFMYKLENIRTTNSEKSDDEIV